MIQPLWRTVWRFLEKLKTELPYDPAIPLLGIYPEKMKTLIRRNTCTPVFRAVLFTIAKTWKQHEVYIYVHHRRCGVHIYNGILLGHKKN